MQDIFETLCDAEKGLTKEKERELEFICYGIEGKEDFNNLFFFTNKENYEYFYLESQESEIKEYLSQYINVNALEKKIAEWMCLRITLKNCVKLEWKK